MRLAPDDFLIEHAGHCVRLRPSLRAAYRLDLKHKSIGYVIHGIQQVNVSVMADVVVECCGDAHAARRILMTTVDENGVAKLAHMVDPLIGLVLASYGVSSEPAERDASRKHPGERITYREQLEELYAIATGWLGWSHDEALAATPDQIDAAYRGYQKKLHAINGGGKPDERAPYDPRNLPSDDEIAEGVNRLRALSGKRKAT